MSSTVDGRGLTASATSEPELFWALRGGGGNFGVATRFTFRATALPAVVEGRIHLALDDLVGTLRAWRDVMRAAPDELSVTFLALPGMGPDAPPAAQLVACYAGDDEGRAGLRSRRCSRSPASRAPTSRAAPTSTSSIRPWRRRP